MNEALIINILPSAYMDTHEETIYMAEMYTTVRERSSRFIYRTNCVLLMIRFYLLNNRTASYT